MVTTSIRCLLSMVAAFALVGAILAPVGASTTNQVEALANEIAHTLDKLRAAALDVLDHSASTQFGELAEKVVHEARDKLYKLVRTYGRIVEKDKDVTICEAPWTSAEGVIESYEVIDGVTVLKATNTITYAGCYDGVLVNSFFALILPNGELYADGTGTFTGTVAGMDGTVVIRNGQYWNGFPVFTEAFGAEAWSGGTGGLAGTAGADARPTSLGDVSYLVSLTVG